MPVEGDARMVVTVPHQNAMTVSVFDLLRRRVRVVVEGVRPAGVHPVVWDCHDGGGARVPAGVCVCMARCGRQTASTRMVVMR
jgi:hypothetical protein